MKKHLTALALGITTALSAVPLMPANALAPPMSGDLNNDWTVNMADLVIMQRYLLGIGGLDMTFGIYTADVNFDNRIDIFDYIEIRKMIESQSDKITYRFTNVDYSIPIGVQYGKQSFNESAVITSVHELEEYFQPCHVITTGMDCVTIDVASQEVINDYLDRYDEEFFERNVLLLNYLRGTDSYEFESIQYDDSALVIRYYDSAPYGFTWYMQLPPYIGEVAVPKNLWADGDVIWEEVDPPVEMTVKTDFTNAINDKAIINSYAKPSLITSSEELDIYLSGKFHTGVEMSLKDTYNNEFFEENNVILDLYYQNYHDDWETSLSVDNDNYNNIVFTYDRQFIDGYVDYGIQINQVVISKEQCHFTEVSKVKTWETPIDVSHSEFDLFQISEMLDINANFFTSYEKSGEWINSAEEMETYLTEYITSDEVTDFLSPAFSSIDWSKESAYLWIDSDVIGSIHRLMDSAGTDEDISISFSSKQPLSCMGGNFLHIIKTSKTQSGKTVIKKNINMNDDMPHIDGEYSILQFGYDVVMVNQYTFRNKNVADIYHMHIGGGPSMWSGYDYIGTVEFAEDYFPVQNDTEHISYAEGEKIVMETGEYKITIENNELTISYKYSADSEYTEQTFNY